MCASTIASGSPLSHLLACPPFRERLEANRSVSRSPDLCNHLAIAQGFRSSDRQPCSVIFPRCQCLRRDGRYVFGMDEGDFAFTSRRTQNPFRLDCGGPRKGIGHKTRRLHESEIDSTGADSDSPRACHTPVPTFWCASMDESFTRCITPAVFAACAAASSRLANSARY
jgi:hypothetical protein